MKSLKLNEDKSNYQQPNQRRYRNQNSKLFIIFHGFIVNVMNMRTM